MSISTEDCKVFIADYLNEHDEYRDDDYLAKDWKRTRKYKNESGNWIRDFEHTSGKTFTVIEINGVLSKYKATSTLTGLDDESRFKLRLEDDIGTSIPDNMHMYVYEMLDNFDKLRSDLAEINCDYENVGDYGPISGVHVLECGVPVFIYSHGGDWESPVTEAIFWTGNEWRGYVPREGNFYNKITNSAFGNDDSDPESIKNDYGHLLTKYKLTFNEDSDEYDLMNALENKMGTDLPKILLADINKYVSNLIGSTPAVEVSTAIQAGTVELIIPEVKETKLTEDELALLVEDAARYRWIRDNVKEAILNPKAFNSEIMPDTRLKYELPVLISLTCVNEPVSFDDAVDLARNTTKITF